MKTFFKFVYLCVVYILTVYIDNYNALQVQLKHVPRQRLQDVDLIIEHAMHEAERHCHHKKRIHNQPLNGKVQHQAHLPHNSNYRIYQNDDHHRDHHNHQKHRDHPHHDHAPLNHPQNHIQANQQIHLQHKQDNHHKHPQQVQANHNHQKHHDNAHLNRPQHHIQANHQNHLRQIHDNHHKHPKHIQEIHHNHPQHIKAIHPNHSLHAKAIHHKHLHHLKAIHHNHPQHNHRQNVQAVHQNHQQYAQAIHHNHPKKVHIDHHNHHFHLKNHHVNPRHRIIPQHPINHRMHKHQGNPIIRPHQPVPLNHIQPHRQAQFKRPINDPKLQEPGGEPGGFKTEYVYKYVTSSIYKRVRKYFTSPTTYNPNITTVSYTFNIRPRTTVTEKSPVGSAFSRPAAPVYTFNIRPKTMMAERSPFVGVFSRSVAHATAKPIVSNTSTPPITYHYPFNIRSRTSPTEKPIAHDIPATSTSHSTNSTSFSGATTPRDIDYYDIVEKHPRLKTVKPKIIRSGAVLSGELLSRSESVSESDSEDSSEYYDSYYDQDMNRSTTEVWAWPTIDLPAECNFTSEEARFWNANKSLILKELFPPESLVEVTNRTSEEKIRNWFHPQDIQPQYMPFYRWYYQLVIDPERIERIHNKTIEEDIDFHNLSQYTPFPIPEEKQRYYMFVNYIENQADHEEPEPEKEMDHERKWADVFQDIDDEDVEESIQYTPEVTHGDWFAQHAGYTDNVRFGEEHIFVEDESARRIFQEEEEFSDESVADAVREADEEEEYESQYFGPIDLLNPEEVERARQQKDKYKGHDLDNIGISGEGNEQEQQSTEEFFYQPVTGNNKYKRAKESFTTTTAAVPESDQEQN